MLNMQEPRCAVKKTMAQQIEEAVKNMIADRILPADFQLKEINEDCAWGTSETVVVRWDGLGYALALDTRGYMEDLTHDYVTYNEETEAYELQKCFPLFPASKFNVR